MGKIYEAVQEPKQGGTGTTQQKPIGTGTDTSGTGTIVSKMPRLCSFAYLSLNSCTDSIRTLLND